MIMEILCFFAGTAFFYLKSPYPLYFLCIVLFFRPKFIFFTCFCAALLWSLLHQWLIAEQGMPNVRLIRQAQLEGWITSIPNQSAYRTQFQFLAKKLNQKPIASNLLLSCYNNCPSFKAGQYWQFRAKLKRPMNLANPGSFNYLEWLSSRHIHWVGNVRSHTLKRMENHSIEYNLLKLREYFSDLLIQMDPDEESLGVFQALTLGITSHIDKSQWELFRETGTTHLIDISGEHIALVTGIAYWLIKWGWKCLGQLCLQIPAPKIASFGAMIIALIYSLIAGFSVPTQRSLITCFFFLYRNLCNQYFTIWQAWRYALLTVILLEPHSVYMLGFYFSFIAVAILILINQRVRCKGLRKMLLMQAACLMGLMPLTLYWFSYTSFSSFIANMVAIPLVSFLIVPLALSITFISPWFIMPKTVVVLKWLIGHLIIYLHWINSLLPFQFHLAYNEGIFPLALMISMAIFLFLPIRQLFPVAGLILLTSLFPGYEKIPFGTANIDLLDVGQGLSVAVRTANHRLLYDTGMKFMQNSDMGKLVIVPYLRTLGVKNIDKVIISHPDLDHLGGLTSVAAEYDIGELIVDDPTFYQRGHSCHTYPSWTWDGVNFQFFPIDQQLNGKNNHSCVLQISSKDEKILLSGDIERSAEQYLLQNYGQKLASDILLIPHHGSKTSSSVPFVEQVAPRYAIVSYGFDNRYRFPHAQVMRVYQQHHIPIYNTSDCGMIRVNLQGKQPTPWCYRRRYTRAV
jgi:competence protein ComEC